MAKRKMQQEQVEARVLATFKDGEIADGKLRYVVQNFVVVGLVPDSPQHKLLSKAHDLRVEMMEANVLPEVMCEMEDEHAAFCTD